MSQELFIIWNRSKDPIYVDGKELKPGGKGEYNPRSEDYAITWNDSLDKRYILELNQGSVWKIKRTAQKEIKLKLKTSSPGNEKNDTVTIEDNEGDGGEG